MNFGVLLEAGGIFALGGEDDGEGEAEEIGLAAGEGGERDDDVSELVDGGFFRRRGLAHQAQALVHGVVDQRLEQAFLVAEVIIERGFGDLRLVGDVLHRSSGIAAVGEEFQANIKQALARIGGRFGHGGPRSQELVRGQYNTYRSVGKARTARTDRRRCQLARSG